MAGTFFTDRKSGGGRCAEVTVIRGSTVVDFKFLLKEIKADKKQNGLIKFKSSLILTNMFIFWPTGCEMILNRANLYIYLLFKTLKRQNSQTES